MKLKQLNYKSIEELERTIDRTKLISAKPGDDGRELITKLTKLHKRIVDDKDKGDQESNYLNYLAFVILHKEVQRSKLYKADRTYCELMITKETVNEINSKYNNLRKSLTERYDQDKLLNFKSVLSAGLNDSASSLSTNEFISCKELYDLLKQLSSSTAKASVLLIDLRRKEDYNKSSIYFKDDKFASALITINIPEDKISKGYTCANIESILNPNELIQFQNRNEAHTVILLDYESTSLSSNDKLFIFYQALTKFDTTSNRLKKEPQLLKGGFNDWLLHYPMHCTDSSVQFSNSFDRQLDDQRTANLDYSNDLSVNKLNNVFNSLNAGDGDVVERIYSKNKERNSSIPGSAQFVRPAASSSFTNNLSNNFSSSTNSTSLLTDDEDSSPQQSNDKKVIYHKIHFEKDDDNRSIDSKNSNNFLSTTNKYFSKPVSAFKNEPTQTDFSSSFGEAPSIFSNNLNNGRRSKSYTNLTESLSPEDDEEESTFNHHYPALANKPSFDRTNKPNSLLNDITNRPSSLSASIYREFSPIYGTSYHPTGLKNLGNTCFMNAVIQCLFNVKHFSNYFISDTYLKHINRNSKFGTRGELTEEFGVLMGQMNNPQVKHISPKDFRRIVGKHISVYSGCEQQDSHEFLLILFEKLHADLNTSLAIKTITEIPDTMPSKEAIERFWRDHLTNNNSIISKQFEGLIMSTLECDACQKKSNTFEVFTCLSLPIPINFSSSRCDLEDCLKEFTKNERMCDEAAWQCPTCKVKRPATKKTSIVKLPKVLIIHLKR